MLNLNRDEQALTQGQPPGKRVVARSVQIDEVNAQTESQASTPASQTAGGDAQADPQAVARRVFDLMRRDLQVDHERRKPGR